MPQTGPAAEAFGAVTIALVSPFVILAALCIFYTAHLRRQIRRRTLLHLEFFNGPWATRIAFSSVAIWWSLWEIVRLSLLRINPPWQKQTCKLYIVSNVGFAEPAMLFIMIFLLRASLQRKELGVLSRHWNGRTIGWAAVLSVPVFILQLGIVFLGPSVLNKENHVQVKLAAYFWSCWSAAGGGGACTYPLFSIALLGFLDLGLLVYGSCAGARILSLAVNRRLRRRISVFIILVDVFLMLRIIFLSLSVMPEPGGLTFEALVFLGFLAEILCLAAAVSVLVFYPVADSLAVREAVGFDLEEVPFDDYYGESARLVGNDQSLDVRLEPDRSSDVSTKRGSISFRTMI